MGPIVRLVSLVLILGTWWVMSGDASSRRPAAVATTQTVASASFDIQ